MLSHSRITIVEDNEPPTVSVIQNYVMNLLNWTSSDTERIEEFRKKIVRSFSGFVQDLKSHCKRQKSIFEIPKLPNKLFEIGSTKQKARVMMKKVDVVDWE